MKMTDFTPSGRSLIEPIAHYRSSTDPCGTPLITTAMTSLLVLSSIVVSYQLGTTGSTPVPFHLLHSLTVFLAAFDAGQCQEPAIDQDKLHQPCYLHPQYLSPLVQDLKLLRHTSVST